MSICYEIIFPDLVRQPVKKWSRIFSQYNQRRLVWEKCGIVSTYFPWLLCVLLKIAPLLFGLLILVSVDFLDATGKIRNTTQLFKRELIADKIAPNKGPRTFYSKFGDIFSYLCLALTAIISLLAYRFLIQRILRSN